MSNFSCRAAVNSFLTVLVLVAVLSAMGEILLRIKNSDQRNYVVEMWRYARELKAKDLPELGHTHQPNVTATLQNTVISLNSRGMRGPEPDNRQHVLLLGSSIVLGWGVAEEDTLRAQLEGLLGGRYSVLNAGIGNYNLTRAVTLYDLRLRDIKPKKVVVGFFLRDAELLDPSDDNVLLRHSQFAVLLYHLIGGLVQGGIGPEKLVAHYERVYSPASQDFRAVTAAMDRLKELSKQDGFDVVIAMIPDVHQLQPYPFEFAHRAIEAQATNRGFTFIDLYPSLQDYQGPDLWTIPGDPHPNATAHKAMAKAIAPHL